LWRVLRARAARRLLPWARARRGGTSIALLAADGAGKSTLARTLAADATLKARVIYMGRRRDGAAKTHLIRLWGCSLRGLTERLRGRVVVYDRHAWECVAAPAPHGARQRLRHWLLRHTNPAPDLFVVLDAPAAVLAARKPEHPVEELERRRTRLLGAGELRPRHVVDASREADAVRREVVDLVWRLWNTRSAGSGMHVHRY